MRADSAVPHAQRQQPLCGLERPYLVKENCLSRFTLLLLLLLPGAVNASTKGRPPLDSPPLAPPNFEIDFCQFSVREVIRSTQTDFTASFSFDISPANSPTNIKDTTHLTRSDAIRWGWPAEYITSASPGSERVLWTHDELFILTCLSSWKLTGVPAGTRLTAEFRWDHRYGWASLHISGKGINYTVKESGYRCQSLH